MKIVGAKHINSNFYDSLMIRSKKEGLQIDAKGSNKINTKIEKQSFCNLIKKLSDKEQINEIIRYYLRNNKICKLRNGYVEYYDGKFIIVEGSRNLYIQVQKSSVDTNILKDIIKKYKNDRLNFLYNNNFKNIEIYFGGDEMSYSTYSDKDKEILQLRLASKDGVLNKNEEIFFMNYIKYLFDRSEDTIEAYARDGYYIYKKGIDNACFGDYSGYYVRFDDYIIKLDSKLYFKILDLVIEHNKNLAKINKLQLTFKFK